jgi:hypothetical protein
MNSVGLWMAGKKGNNTQNSLTFLVAKRVFEYFGCIDFVD